MSQSAKASFADIVRQVYLRRATGIISFADCDDRYCLADPDCPPPDVEPYTTEELQLRFDFERASFFSFRTPVEVEVYSDSITELHSMGLDIGCP